MYICMYAHICHVCHINIYIYTYICITGPHMDRLRHWECFENNPGGERRAQFAYVYVYIYIYIYTYVCLCIYIYIYIHRERERER